MSMKVFELPTESKSSNALGRVSMATDDLVTAPAMEPQRPGPPLAPPNRRASKGKDSPRRPLSAYNLFFRSERKRICEDIQTGKIPTDYMRFEEKALEKLKGKGSKAHFQAVACTIAARWKVLPKNDRAEYEKLAESETAAYIERKHEYHRAIVRECAAAARLASTSQSSGNHMPSFARNGITEQTKDLDGSSGTTPPSIASETNVTNDTLLGTLRHGYQNLTVASIPLPRMMMLKQNRATVNGALLERNNVLPPLPAPVFTVPGSFTPLPGLPPQNNYNDTLMWQNQFAQTNQTSAQHMTQQEARYLMQQYEEDMLSSRMRILQEQLRLQEQEEERGRLMALLNLQHRHQAPTVAQETWAVPGRWVPNNGDERYNDPGFLDAILLAQRNARNNGTE
uniref:HMG box domain-containing protein n=2 Tax=Amphora coffeiformis TaxID=265554 RepID=A0A7S3KZV2_9STRA|mmetsp:Transcript_18273/g.36791  ORF Transcript_18273/g.36791 Transcript_18273/m.36791 type:complete len:397 (+) Transcript_18273:99-1289(+)